MANTDKKLVMANLVLTGVILVMVAAYVIDFKLPGGKGSGDIFDQLTAKLDAHSELSKYKGAFPTVAKITQADLEFARQNNPEFFKDAKVGDYFLTYPGLILIYDYESGRIVNMVEQEMAPEDLVAKLLAHAELEGYANASVPLITRLDDQTLSAAQANNPAFFGQARSGDYLVDWNDLSVIYDYGNDRIVNFAAKLVIPDDFGACRSSRPLHYKSNNNKAGTGHD